MPQARLVKTFAECTYLVQVRRLRKLAILALKQYLIKVSKIEFIHHGENATFKVCSEDGKQFLLRIHRGGYHTKEAIQEELSWLIKLGKNSDLAIPRPVRSKNGHLSEKIFLNEVGVRQCCVFKWLPGRFIEKSLNEKQMFQLGQFIAYLHSKPPKTRHRFYWDANGLVGPNPKFGSFKNLHSVSKIQQKKITEAGEIVYKKLLKFQNKYPDRMGLIHADLHFGNILLVNNKIAAIDFDDCGYGFFAYDILIPILSAEAILGKKGKGKFLNIKDSLLAGYKTSREWDQADDKILDFLTTARKITMLGWLNSRSDNPRLKKHIKKAVKRTMHHLENATHLK